MARWATNDLITFLIFLRIEMKAILSIAVLVSACYASSVPKIDLPVVDLGYELHQAISFNVNHAYSPFPSGFNRIYRAPTAYITSAIFGMQLLRLAIYDGRNLWPLKAIEIRFRMVL